MTESTRSGKLSALQGLRALAALLVVVDHALLNLIEQGLAWDGAEAVAHRLGAAGVFIFFVISGFIMAFTSNHEVGLGGALQFMARRLWRIVPLYWLATAVYCVRLHIGGTPPSGADIWRSLLFVPYLDEALSYHPVLGVGWTLNFEMYFYLLFGASLLLPRLLGLAAIGALFGGSVAAGALLGWHDGSAGVFAKFLTDPIILFFLLGILVHLTMGATGLGRMNGKQAVIAGLLALLALTLLVTTITPSSIFGMGIYALAPLLVALAIAAPAWNQAALSRVTVLLGDASYSIYLTHSFVVGPLVSVAAALGMVWAALPLVAVAFVLSAMAGIACYLLVEKPMLALLRPLFLPSLTPKPA